MKSNKGKGLIGLIIALALVGLFGYFGYTTMNDIKLGLDLAVHYTPNVAEEAELEAVLSTSLGFGGHNACIAFRKFKG